MGKRQDFKGNGWQFARIKEAHEFISTGINNNLSTSTNIIRVNINNNEKILHRILPTKEYWLE